MFQSFEVVGSPQHGAARLAALRAEMATAGCDAFLVPRADAHQGEYVADCDARLAWLTGFTGSAGSCVVLKDRAGVFIDGRYRVQVRDQVDLSVYTPVPWPETKLGAWIAEHLDGGAVGYDAWLHTRAEVTALRKALAPRGIALQPVENLVDRIWDDRPAPPAGRAWHHPEHLAGRSAGEKRTEIAGALRDAGQRAAVLSLPDSICWLLNIRGADIPRIPILQSFAIVFADGRVTLFTDPRKCADLDLGPEVSVAPPEAFLPALATLGGPVRVDPKTAPEIVFATLDAAGVAIAEADDPCLIPKACKTGAELDGARAAHLRDAVAMCRLLAWLDTTPPDTLTEIDVVRSLEEFRRETNALRDISFETIAGAGPNAAIVHYRVSEATNRALAPGELLLVDSGGQYEDGTTDITRTIALGDVGPDRAEAFTRVLKGMIAISRARFPKGLAGRDLDALARMALWEAGQDYDHGTGHGVGSYLSVHEGPQRLARTGEVALRPGMILSNEPGYYRDGSFGIRIENLVAVAEAPALPGGDDRAMLCFETLTWVPIDRRLIVPDMLSDVERDWIDGYHHTVRDRIGPLLSDDSRAWLDRATAPL